MNVVVVIPVYKKIDLLNVFETASLKNTCVKFNSQQLTFVGPPELRAEYMEIYPNLFYIDFSSSFFESIGGYNRLLKSARFYKRFENYSHILIVQLDVWIFGDIYDLHQFECFDYCGAPSISNGELIGYNGGLSLRNVQKALKALKKFSNYESVSAIFHRHILSKGLFRIFFLKWGSFIFDVLLRKRIAYPFNYYYKGNEDIFWSVEVPKAFPDFRIIDYESALAFSWEHDCEKFHDAYSLPFGCHGWWNYNYDFWKDIIRIE